MAKRKNQENTVNDEISEVDVREEAVPGDDDSVVNEANAGVEGEAPQEAEGEGEGEGETKEKKTRVRKHYPDDAVINFGEKDGVAYSPLNNPKRGGSKSAERFGMYRDGMTVREWVEAVGSRGLAVADLAYDSNKGFITITHTSAPAEGGETSGEAA